MYLQLLWSTDKIWIQSMEIAMEIAMEMSVTLS